VGHAHNSPNTNPSPNANPTYPNKKLARDLLSPLYAYNRFMAITSVSRKTELILSEQSYAANMPLLTE